MSSTYRALRVFDTNGVQTARVEPLVENQSAPGEVSIRVRYSSLNYKDALAVTGRGKILRRFPLTPGIDAAGEVVRSANAKLKVGDQVLVTGGGLGETADGGYSDILHTRADHVVPKPAGLSLVEAMILGTAGFTAALALHRMTQNGQTPDLGPILVTGASGGVGSFATQIFSRAGFEVHAVSAKRDQHDYLKNLGATTILSPDELALGAKGLETVRFGGAVDNVGGEVLSRTLAHVQLWGNVASIGLAMGTDIHATVMPFILRGVSLLGISSNNTPLPTRLQIWQRLAGPWKPPVLGSLVTKTVGLHELTSAAQDMLARRTHGRILVDLGRT